MKKAIGLAVLTAAMGFVGQAAASGFQLFEQSGSGQGRAFAGMGAASDDASVQWYNPASLTAIQGHQIVAGAHYIVPSADYKDDGSTGLLQLLPGSGDDNGGQSALVPNLFWKGYWGGHDIGLSIVAPFGLETRYDEDWRGRYLGVKSDLRTININPSLARKLGNLSLGVGISAQYLDVTLTKKAYSGTPGQDYFVDMSGTAWAWGYNLGMRYQTQRNTVGLAFRSTMDQKVRGRLKVYDAAGNLLAPLSEPVKSDITLPATVDLSWAHRYNEALEVLASATWTGWGSFKELRVVGRTSGTTRALTPEKWHDTWRLAVGANYRLNDQWMLRGGLAYDQTPVRDAYRTVRIPDNDRRWLSIGARYTVSPTLKVDMAYTHIFTDTTPINETAYAGNPPTAIGQLKGTYDSAVDIASIQVVWNY